MTCWSTDDTCGVEFAAAEGSPDKLLLATHSVSQLCVSFMQGFGQPVVHRGDHTSLSVIGDAIFWLGIETQVIRRIKGRIKLK